MANKAFTAEQELTQRKWTPKANLKGGVQMARMKGPKKTNRYPDDFKIKAVQLADHPDILANSVVGYRL